MRHTGPKTKLARRIGEPLRDKDAKYLVKRNYPPGMHGQSRRRISEFGQQLAEKQKARWIYQISERQFARYAQAAARNPAVTGDALLRLLETRLDNVVYRLGFASSRAQARQLTSHGFVTVNGKKAAIPSYQVKVGDQIAVSESKRNSKYIEQVLPRIKEHKPQEWLQLDAKNLTGRILSHPTADNTGSTLRMELVIEHYSR